MERGLTISRPSDLESHGISIERTVTMPCKDHNYINSLRMKTNNYPTNIPGPAQLTVRDGA